MKKPSHASARRKPGRTIKQKFPAGWNERKVRAVIQHYEQISDDELAREIESAPELTDETLISVPTELLPAVRKLIADHRKSA
jgi:O-phosphoseryl-tRNA(Cys) synthetase